MVMATMAPAIDVRSLNQPGRQGRAVEPRATQNALPRLTGEDERNRDQTRAAPRPLLPE